MEITHTKTESASALPAYLSPSEMDWELYKAGELLPNGRYVSLDGDKTSIVHGFIKNNIRRKYNEGYQSGMDIPDYSFTFTERSCCIEIMGSNGSNFEKFKILFSSLAERDKFIFKDLEVAVASRPA